MRQRLARILAAAARLVLPSQAGELLFVATEMLPGELEYLSRRNEDIDCVYAGAMRLTLPRRTPLAWACSWRDVPKSSLSTCTLADNRIHMLWGVYGRTTSPFVTVNRARQRRQVQTAVSISYPDAHRQHS